MENQKVSGMCGSTVAESATARTIEGIEKDSKKATRTLRSNAKKMEEAAKKEMERKKKCLFHERAIQRTQIDCSELTTPPRKTQKMTTNEYYPNVGEFVTVEPDLSPGKKSYGGTGWIMSIYREDRQLFLDIAYNKNCSQRTEMNVPIERVTVIDAPLRPTAPKGTKRSSKRLEKASPPTKQKCRKKNSTTKQFPRLVDALQHGNRYRKSRGWRKKELGLDNNKRGCKEVQLAMSADYRELREYLTTSSKHEKGITQAYLSYAWGCHKDAPREAYLASINGETRYKRKLKERNNGILPQNKKMKCVISCRESARSYYTPKRLYIIHSMATFRRNNPSYSPVSIPNYRKRLEVNWKKLPIATRQIWSARSREHDEKWSGMKQKIIDSLRNNPTNTFMDIERDIQHWCSYRTIHAWLKSQTDFNYYSQRIVPLVTEEQRRKHVAFAARLRNHWYLPQEIRQKILFINYDEKWFYGLVPRMFAKQCPNLNLYRKELKAYHKNFLNKVMVIAITAYAFKDHIEKGGHGVKIGLIRCQAAKIASRNVRESRRDVNGKVRYDGKLKRKAGDVFFVETTVAGSCVGTSASPKFSLKACFQEVIYPKIDSLTGKGGAFEGYVPILQGDNAGPHTDKSFLSAMMSHCSEKGWHWEPQGPQMPYLNNLDLAVFPAMSKKHTRLITNSRNTVAKTDTIFDAAVEVWKELPSADIARSYVLAYHLASKVIKEKGDNSFLAGGNFHSDVRRDFIATKTGIRRRYSFRETVE